jgi:lipid A 3-O-deacylase
MLHKKEVVFAVCLISFLSLSFGPSANAQIVDSARVGVFGHNLGYGGTANSGKSGSKEDGVDISAEIAFATPSFLKWAGAPKPTAGGSLNSAGETSFVFVGLRWDWALSEKWRAGFGGGYAVHNGEYLDNPFAPADSVRRAKFDREELALGSRDLFHWTLSAEYALSEQWAVEGVIEHLSHGDVLSKIRNPGLDNAGIRMVRKFR